MGFFNRVLPEKGPFTLFTGVTGPDGKLWEPQHWNGLQTHEALEKKIQELSMQPLNIFYATGSYAKPNRKSPVAKRALWLDLDFKDLGSLENALRGLSAFVRAVGLPPPSVYVSSGHGLHVYWPLNRDVPIAEWLPVARALKAKCDELGFAADPTSTADQARVLRCPGTLNRKGKEPVPCVVSTDRGVTFSLEEIAAQLGAASVPSTVSKMYALAPPDALITKPSFRPLTADEVAAMLACVKLPAIGGRDLWFHILCAVQDWGQKSEESWDLLEEWAITQPEHDPKENRRVWDSFSPDGGITIATLVKMATDAGYVPPGVPAPVSASLPTSLAEQIAASDDDDDAPVASVIIAGSDPLLIALQHAVNSTGKVRFTLQEASTWLSSEFVLMTEQPDFYFSMTKRMLLTDRIINKMITRWMPLNSSHRPTKATLILEQCGTKQSVKAPGYHPTAPTIYVENGTSYANRYTAPAPMLAALPVEIKMIEMFWAHMFPRAEDQVFSKYMLQTYGHLVQHPEIKIESAPLVIGEPGSGKTTLTYAIVRRLVGVQNALLVDNETLKGSFNGHAGDKHVFYFDEIKVQGRWDSEDISNSMKNLVVGETLMVHAKFQTPFEIPNRMFVTATSNYDDAMFLASSKERRWGVYEHFPPNDLKTMKRFFVMFHHWLKSPRGPGVLRGYFNQVDLTGYSPHDAPPWTKAKDNMVAQSQSREVQVLAELIKYGSAPFDRALITFDRVQQALHSATGKVYSPPEAGKFLRKAASECVEIKTVWVNAKAVRTFCWRDVPNWVSGRTDAEIKKELG
jgi:hypothetical protein